MKWRLKNRVDERDALLGLCASSLDEMAAFAEEWQTLLGQIAHVMEAIERGETIAPETAANVRSASVDLCLNLSVAIAGCQVAADTCRSLRKLPDRNFAGIGSDVLPSRGS